MRRIQNRKTFEEGDNVIVKGVDRKGTVNKRKGDFYDVTLDATQEQEKNNVFAGDMVKASKSIKSMAIKQIEKYYKQGILNKREVIAVLMKENGWSFPEAKQIADYYERVFSDKYIQSSRLIKSAITWEQYQKYENYVKELTDVISKRLNLPSFDIEQQYYFVWAICDSNGYRYDISMDYATPENPDWKNQHHKEGKITVIYESLTDYNKPKEFSFYSSKNIDSDSNVIVDWFERVSGSIKNSRQVNSRFNQTNGKHLFTLSEAAQYLSALFFDLREIHFNTTGSEFYTYHELAQELYEQTEDFYDDLVETAISFDSDVSPMYVLPGDWSFITNDEDLSTDGVVYGVQNVLLDKLSTIYDILSDVQEYDSMVRSKIDSMLEYYDKEIYKLKQALK